jgi:fumarylacetoacetase
MIETLNETHDPARKSWVGSANAPNTPFPIQNLPFGVFARVNAAEPSRVGVAIGNFVLDVVACYRDGLFPEAVAEAAEACGLPMLNAFAALGQKQHAPLRRAISDLLRADHPNAAQNQNAVRRHLTPMSDVEMQLPFAIGDYTDFYASVFHATNVGSMFRPDNPLLPNYKYVPIGYHGRSSSIVVSGAAIHRPAGQIRPDSEAPPFVAPTRSLDYELEVGAFIGLGQTLGDVISIERASEHIFGLCLLNDWSARDIQAWEYQPLGPFLAKNFATTISPWIVTWEALAPFRTAAFVRPDGDPSPLPYLDAPSERERGGVQLLLEAWLLTQRMRDANVEPVRLSVGRFADMYWTLGQLVTHHASGGCNLRPGDLLGSGTVSGPEKESRGCLLELSWRGAEPVTLPNGETRRFLEDGDEVIFRGWCMQDGFASIGFGDCRGIVIPGKQ